MSRWNYCFRYNQRVLYIKKSGRHDHSDRLEPVERDGRVRRLEWKRDTDTGAARRWNEDEDERGRWLRPAQLILTVTRRAAVVRGGRGGSQRMGGSGGDTGVADSIIHSGGWKLHGL